MADKAETAQPDMSSGCRQFASGTCCALIDLVLEEASRSPQSKLSPSEHLQSLCQSDSVFADWYARLSKSVCGDHVSCAGQIKISSALVSDPSWRTESHEAKRLWQIANLVSRLETFSMRFDKTLEEGMRHTVYELAYGLSHELNNPLANIATRAGVLVHDESSAHRRQLLETIIDNAMRGSEMIGDLMLIARPPTLNVQVVDLDQWIGQFIANAQSWAAKYEVNVVLIHECKNLTVHFDPIAIKEALWCLVRNAIEASQAEGTVTIRLTATSSGEEKCSLLFQVLDQGAGLSPYALEHCFDLYYSGREAGRGLGMGLAKARRIIELHGGQVSLTNRPEGGSEARLRIEISDFRSQISDLQPPACSRWIVS